MPEATQLPHGEAELELNLEISLTLRAPPAMPRQDQMPTLREAPRWSQQPEAREATDSLRLAGTEWRGATARLGAEP